MIERPAINLHLQEQGQEIIRRCLQEMDPSQLEFMAMYHLAIQQAALGHVDLLELDARFQSQPTSAQAAAKLPFAERRLKEIDGNIESRMHNRAYQGALLGPALGLFKQVAEQVRTHIPRPAIEGGETNLAPLKYQKAWTDITTGYIIAGEVISHKLGNELLTDFYDISNTFEKPEFLDPDQIRDLSAGLRSDLQDTKTTVVVMQAFSDLVYLEGLSGQADLAKTHIMVGGYEEKLMAGIELAAVKAVGKKMEAAIEKKRARPGYTEAASGRALEIYNTLLSQIIQHAPEPPLSMAANPYIRDPYRFAIANMRAALIANKIVGEVTREESLRN